MIAQWSETIPKRLATIAEWSGMIPKRSEMIARWSGMITGWSETIAGQFCKYGFLDANHSKNYPRLTHPTGLTQLK